MRDPDFARYSTLWARLRHVALFHSGNFYLTTRAEDEVGAGVWMQAAGRRKVGPLTNPWEMPFVDLTPYLSVERVVSPGFVHLTEGVAKIVETIQRRFTGEPGEQSPHGTKAVSLRDFVNRAESPIDPYYVTRIAFGAMRDPSSTMAPFDEYILLLSDMAMMFDPLLTPDAFSQLYGGLSDDDMDAARSGMSPFGIFLQLARLFWRHAPKLELSTELPLNEQAAAFQDGLLAAAGLQLSMSELTSECREQVSAFDGRLVEHFVLGGNEGARETLRASFIRGLDVRRDHPELNGSGICGDLLDDRENLLRMLKFLAPSFAVGWLVVSSETTLSPDHGVGVDQSNLQADRELLDAVFFGNGPCPAAGNARRARRCPLPAVPLCEALPARLPPKGSQAYCVREQTLEWLRSLGASEIEWGVAPAGSPRLGTVT